MVNFINRLNNSLTYRYRYAWFRLTTFYWKLITKILISNKREFKQKDALFVWVPVWGEKHIKWFFEYTLPSLLTSANLPLVSKDKKIKIYFYTKDVDESLIINYMKVNSCEFNYCVIKESYFIDMARSLMSNFMIHILNECIQKNALLLIAQPDLVFSDGSVSNLVKLSDGKGVSISVAHPRVSIDKLKKNDVDILSLSKNVTLMVKTALDYAHDTLLYADEAIDVNNTMSGIATRKLPSGLAVIHNLPAVYLCSPIQDDLTFFLRRPDFNIIDKAWPHLLFRQSRLKVIGSSDIAFLIELTSDEIKPKLKSGLKYNDFLKGIFTPFVNYSNVMIGLWRSK